MSQHDKINEHLVRSDDQRTCFLVYSTRENHIPTVVERLTDFLSNELNFSIVKLDEARVAGKQLLPDIIRYTKECDMSIVILDGLRPNVLLELGMILANQKPCIILIERNAKINISSLISDTGRKPKAVPQIKIDIQRHISDISNISWNEYLLDDDITFRILIRSEILKLQPFIEKKQPHNHQGYFKKDLLLIKQIDSSIKLSFKRHKQIIATAYRKIKDLPKEQYGHIVFHIARSLTRRNELQTAFREVVHGLDVCPDFYLLLVHKSWILFNLGQKKEGFKVIKAALHKYPRNKYIQREYLQMLNLDNKPKDVLKILSHVTYESLLIDNLISIKANALFNNGEIEASLKLLIEMYEYDSNKWAIHKVMTLLKDLQQVTLSKDLINKISRNVQKALENKNVPCYECFIDGCKILSLTELAINLLYQYSKVVKKNDPESLNGIAFRLIELEEYKKAKSVLQDAIKKFPDDSYLNATWGLYKLQFDKKLVVGKRYYNKAIKLRPQDMPLKRMYYYQLGKFYDCCGKKTLAKDNYSLALQVKTDYRQLEIKNVLNNLNKIKRGQILKKEKGPGHREGTG